MGALFRRPEAAHSSRPPPWGGGGAAAGGGLFGAVRDAWCVVRGRRWIGSGIVGGGNGARRVSAGRGNRPRSTSYKPQATSCPPPFPPPRARPACRPRPGAHAVNDAEDKAARNPSTTSHKLRATGRCSRAAFQNPHPVPPQRGGRFRLSAAGASPRPRLWIGPGPRLPSPGDFAPPLSPTPHPLHPTPHSSVISHEAQSAETGDLAVCGFGPYPATAVREAPQSRAVSPGRTLRAGAIYEFCPLPLRPRKR